MGFRTLAVNPNSRLSVGLTARLTCLCPVNARRDYATVEVAYIPTGAVVELESFAAWLGSYAATAISHEEITQAIHDEISETTQTDDLTVRTQWDAIEGVGCVVSVR